MHSTRTARLGMKLKKNYVLEISPFMKHTARDRSLPADMSQCSVTASICCPREVLQRHAEGVDNP